MPTKAKPKVTKSTQKIDELPLKPTQKVHLLDCCRGGCRRRTGIPNSCCKTSFIHLAFPLAFVLLIIAFVGLVLGLLIEGF